MTMKTYNKTNSHYSMKEIKKYFHFLKTWISDISSFSQLTIINDFSENVF